jgi:multisubunit Na+/H+ antiporter MnhC subunit
MDSNLLLMVLALALIGSFMFFADMIKKHFVSMMIALTGIWFRFAASCSLHHTNNA